MIAYKVLARRDGRLFSTNHTRNGCILKQEYFLDKINVPAFKYPLFCFSRLEDAEDFAGYFDVIYLVKGRKSKVQPELMLEPCFVINGFVNEETNIKELIEKSEWSMIDRTIPGVVFMDTVKLIERVK